MSTHGGNHFPKLHNAMWPGLVGKGSPGAEPGIDLDTMLHLTARAEVDGAKFDGVDLFLFDPHVSIDLDGAGIQRLAEKIQAKGFVVGSVVAPVWPPTGGGSAMGTDEDRKRFVEQVRKACRIGQGLRRAGARPYGVVRIDSAAGVADWTRDPDANQAKIAQTFREACEVAESFGERLAAEGEICWGGMHSWRKMVDLLERVDRPHILGFQADMAHTLLYVLGYNSPEDAILPADWNWSDPQRLDLALASLTSALRPWTIDFHVAQNDATVHGSGTHDKTGHHCLPNDPQGKLDIARHAGHWLRHADGQPTRALQHICWDGCMFSNDVMMLQETWNDILRAMITVRDAHGWSVEVTAAGPQPPAVRISTTKPQANVRTKKAKPAKKPATKVTARKRQKPKRKPAKKKLMKKTTSRRKAPKLRSKTKPKSKSARKSGKRRK